MSHVPVIYLHGPINPHWPRDEAPEDQPPTPACVMAWTAGMVFGTPPVVTASMTRLLAITAPQPGPDPDRMPPKPAKAERKEEVAEAPAPRRRQFTPEMRAHISVKLKAYHATRRAAKGRA